MKYLLCFVNAHTVFLPSTAGMGEVVFWKSPLTIPWDTLLLLMIGRYETADACCRAEFMEVRACKFQSITYNQSIFHYMFSKLKFRQSRGLWLTRLSKIRGCLIWPPRIDTEMYSEKWHVRLNNTALVWKLEPNYTFAEKNIIMLFADAMCWKG